MVWAVMKWLQFIALFVSELALRNVGQTRSVEEALKRIETEKRDFIFYVAPFLVRVIEIRN